MSNDEAASNSCNSDLKPFHPNEKIDFSKQFHCILRQGILGGAAYGFEKLIKKELSHDRLQQLRQKFIDENDIGDEESNKLEIIPNHSSKFELQVSPNKLSDLNLSELDTENYIPLSNSLISHQDPINSSCSYVKSRPCSCVIDKLEVPTPTWKPIVTQPVPGPSLDQILSRNHQLNELSFTLPDDKQCQGLERLIRMSSVFYQPNRGIYSFLSRFCPSLLSTSHYDLFYQETLPPIFTITQSCNYWAKYSEHREELKYVLNHNDYSQKSLRTDLCLIIECEELYGKDRVVHTGRFLLAEGEVQLGTCDYILAERRRPIIIAKSDLTRETFIIRSTNYEPGYQDSDFLVLQFGETELSSEKTDVFDIADGSIVALISRRIPKTLNIVTFNSPEQIYPESERISVSFFGKVHPYAKGTIIATSLVLKHDVFN